MACVNIQYTHQYATKQPQAAILIIIMAKVKVKETNFKKNGKIQKIII